MRLLLNRGQSRFFYVRKCLYMSTDVILELDQQSWLQNSVILVGNGSVKLKC